MTTKGTVASLIMNPFFSRSSDGNTQWAHGLYYNYGRERGRPARWVWRWSTSSLDRYFPGISIDLARQCRTAFF